MKKYINGEYIDMTAAEIAAVQEAAEQAASEEKHRALSLSEVQEMLVRQKINTLTVDDQTAYRMMAFYPEWETSTAYTAANGKPVGYKVIYNGRLWKLRQEHTSQAGWEPGATGAESLWEEICETHDGTKYDPIPYSGNMELKAGLYYSQDGTVYRCTRDTGNPVYNQLSELVGLYVEVVITGAEAQ